MPKSISIHRSLGPDAIVSCLVRYVYPRNFFKELFPDVEEYKTQRWSFIVEALREGDESPCGATPTPNGSGTSEKKNQGEKHRRKSSGPSLWLILKHEDYPDLSFRSSAHHVKFVKAGPSNLFFSSLTELSDQQDASDDESLEDENNIEPKEDGIHELDEPPLTSEWNWGPWQELHAHDSRGMMAKADAQLNVGNFNDTQQWTPMQYFDAFFPWRYISDEVVPATNERLNSLFKVDLTLKEFKLYLGIWMTISLNPQYETDDFFASVIEKPRSTTWNPPYLGGLMAEERFKTIHSCLRLVEAKKKPSYHDRLWRVRPLVEAFNNQMESTFHPSWLTTLGQCSLQPNIEQNGVRGKNYHAMACASTHIIFRLEVAETQEERPQEGPNSIAEYEGEMGTLPSTVIRMAKPIWGSQRVVLLDAKFGYLPCICELHKKGLFSTCLVKLRSQWPEGICGEEIEEFMLDKNIGYHGLRHGSSGQYPNVPLWIGAMVDSKHIGVFANTWSTNLPMGSAKKRKVGMDFVDVKYGEYQHWFYFGRDAVNNHTRQRVSNLSFENNFVSDRWELCHFAFVVSLAQINSMNAFNHFRKKPKGEDIVSKASFLQSVAHDLISSNIYEEMESSTKRSTEEVSNYKPFSASRAQKNVADTRGAEIVLPEGSKVAFAQDKKRLKIGNHVLCRIETHHAKWNGNEFPRINNAYTKYTCSAFQCRKEVRTFCSCDCSLILCTACHAKHEHDSRTEGEKESEDTTKISNEEASKESQTESDKSVPTSSSGNPVGSKAGAAKTKLPEGSKVAFHRDKYRLKVGNHILCRIEPFHGRWNGNEFPTINNAYIKYECSMKCGGRKKVRVRTFCSCDCSAILCTRCHTQHALQMEAEKTKL